MTFREKIARWISPSLARQADKFHYLWHQADDCHRWLSEFADVALAAQWLKERDQDHWRALEEPAVGKLPSNIVDFRDFLRSRRNPSPLSVLDKGSNANEPSSLQSDRASVSSGQPHLGHHSRPDELPLLEGAVPCDQARGIAAVQAQGYSRKTPVDIDPSQVDGNPAPTPKTASQAHSGGEKLQVEAEKVQVDAKISLSNLLARIHRDGGHYEEKHGTIKAVADADIIVANLHGDDDEAFAEQYEPLVRSLEPDYEDIARSLSRQLRAMDKRARAANRRADKTAEELSAFRDEIRSLRDNMSRYVCHDVGCPANDLDYLDHSPCACGLRKLYNPKGIHP